MYQPKTDQNIPKSAYGSAAMELLKSGLFPRWAYFVYKDLKQSAAGNPPQLLGFMHENAILLAPVVKADTVKCMLICEDKVQDKTIEMESPCGQKIKVFIPKLDGRYAAIENIDLEIKT